MFRKTLIQQRLTYVEAPPSTNESGAFPYEPAAAYIRTSGAGGTQSTLDLGGGGTQRWALGAIGANEGWKQPFPILEQKEEKNRAKKSEKLRSREKKEWKLVKTILEQKEEKNRAKKSEKLKSREKKEWKLVKTMFF